MATFNPFQATWWVFTGALTWNTFPWLSLQKTNEIKARAKTMSDDPFEQMLIQDDLHKSALSEQNHNNFMQQRQVWRMSLDAQALNTKDPKTKNTSTSVKKMWALADMYRQYGYQHGKNWDSMWDEELVSRFNTKNPQVKQYADAFLTGDDESEYRLAQQLWISGGKVSARAKLNNNFWDNTRGSMKTKASGTVDSWKKFGQRALNNLWGNIYKWVLKKVLWDDYEKITGVNIDDYIDTVTDNMIETEVEEYQNKVNQAYAEREAQNVDRDVNSYYEQKGYTKLLKEWDFKWFLYKAFWDAAENWDMPVIVAASVFQPEVWFALMATDTYARENQDAFETMINNGATYEEAEKWGVVVWLINAAVEVYLEKLLGWAETRASQGIRDIFKKNIQEEITKQWAGRMLLDGLVNQLKASWEEWLEEIVQQFVQNVAVKTVNENQDLFQWLGQAFEWGFYNPMNLLVWGSNIVSGVKNSRGMSNQNTQTNNNNNVRQWILDRITDWGAQKITGTASAQDKLYKAQEPRMNVLSNKKNLEKRRSNSDRANVLIVENGYMPTDTSERLQAHDATMKKIWSQIEQKINGGDEIMVDLTQIADKLDAYIEAQRGTKTTLNEADLERLQREADGLRWQQITLPNVEKLKQQYNSKINNWGEEKVSDILANWLREATHEIWVIEDQLLSEIPWEFQALKNDFGALKDTYEDVFKADMKNQRSKGMWLTETYSRIEWLWDITNWVLWMVTWKWDLGSVAKWASKLLVGKSLAKAKDVDFLIKNWFEELAAQLGKNQNDNWVLYNDIDPNNPVAEMTREQEIQEEINRIMTPKEAMAIVNTAWAWNNLRDRYDWKYRTGEEWLKWEWARAVEMYAENTLASQRLIESYPELLDWDYTFEDVLDAYLEGTLTWKPQDTADRVDLTQTTNYTPTKLYEPQQIEDVKQTWETANKRVTNSNRDEVYKARWDFVIAAHDANMVKELWLTDAEVNKKLRDWSAYPAKAKELSNRLNKDVAPEYRWAWLENSSIVKSITTTDADLEKLVKKVEWRSQEYERKYISNTMLALNTHIDWSPLTFNFVKYWELDYTDAYNKKHTPAGIYSSTSDTISISSAWQNTVAHEMWHYLDYLRWRQLFGNDATLSEWGGRNMDRLATEDQVKFVKNFDTFMRRLKTSADMRNDYTITPTEIFARFVARFTEWTRKTATSDRYQYETKWYNDKFLESDYLEFAKLLQEKSKLDLENNYPNYNKRLELNKKKGESKETIHEDMLKPLPEKIMKNVKVIWDWKDGWKIYEGVKWELAERLLLSTWEWMVRDAYTFRWEPVDLIWGEYDTDGKAWKWLAKISEKHPSVLGKIQSLLDKLKVKEESSKKIVLGDWSYKLVLRKDYDWEKMNWVLTAYEKE